MFLTQRRKDAKKMLRNAVALCAFAALLEKSSCVSNLLSGVPVSKWAGLVDLQGTLLRYGKFAQTISPSTSSHAPLVWRVKDAMHRFAARDVDNTRTLVINILIERAVAASEGNLDVVGGFS